jgi:hypothetical protein
MATDPNDDDWHPADDEEGGGGATMVQAESPHADPAMPLPISIPPPAGPSPLAPAIPKPSPAAGRAPPGPPLPPKQPGTARMAPRPGMAQPVPRAPSPSNRMPLPPPPSARMPVAPPAVPVAERGSTTNEMELPTAMVPLQRNAPVKKAAPEPDEDFDNDRDDGPTMAVAAPSLDENEGPTGIEPLRRSPLASTAFGSVPQKPEPKATPASPPVEEEKEETTRAVSRDELFRQQDAHVIVGSDVLGDEATVAVPAGAKELEGIGAALAESLGPKQPLRQSDPGFAPFGADPAPAFPAPPNVQGTGKLPPFSSGHLPAASSPMAMTNLGPNAMTGPGSQMSPMSQPFPQPMQQQQSWNGPASNAFPPQSMPFPQGQGQLQNAPIPWPHTPPPQVAKPKSSSGGFKMTPQVILLIAVGTVCLAIFVVGLYLFFTTKF